MTIVIKGDDPMGPFGWSTLTLNISGGREVENNQIARRRTPLLD